MAWHPTCYLCTLCTQELPCACCADWHTIEWNEFHDRKRAAAKKKAENAEKKRAELARKAQASPAGVSPLDSAAADTSGSVPSKSVAGKPPPEVSRTGSASPDRSRHYTDGLPEDAKKKKKDGSRQRKPSGSRAGSPTPSSVSNRSRTSTASKRKSGKESLDTDKKKKTGTTPSRDSPSRKSSHSGSRSPKRLSRKSGDEPVPKTGKADSGAGKRPRRSHTKSRSKSPSGSSEGCDSDKGHRSRKPSRKPTVKPPPPKKTKVSIQDLFYSGDEGDWGEFSSGSDDPIVLDSAGDIIAPVAPRMTSSASQRKMPVESSTDAQHPLSTAPQQGFLGGPSGATSGDRLSSSGLLPPPGFTMPLLSPHGLGATPPLTTAATLEGMWAMMREFQSQKDVLHEILRDQRDQLKELASARGRPKSPESEISGVRPLSRDSSPEQRRTKSPRRKSPLKPKSRFAESPLITSPRPDGLSDEDWAAVKAARARKNLLTDRVSPSPVAGSSSQPFRKPATPPRKGKGKGKGAGKSSTGKTFTPHTPPREDAADLLSLHPGEDERISDGSDEDDDFSDEERSYSSDGSEAEDRLGRYQSDYVSEEDDDYVAPGAGNDDSEEEISTSDDDDSTVAGTSAARTTGHSGSGAAARRNRKVPRIQRWRTPWTKENWRVRVPSAFSRVLTDLARSDPAYGAVIPPTPSTPTDRPGDPLFGIGPRPSTSTSPQFPMHPSLPAAFAHDEKKIRQGKGGFNEAALKSRFPATPDDEKKYFSPIPFGQEACDFLRTFTGVNPTDKKVYRDKTTDEMERRDRRVDRDLAHVTRLQNTLLMASGYIRNAFILGQEERFSRRSLQDMIEMIQFLSAHSARITMKTRAMVAHNRRRRFLSVAEASVRVGLPPNVRRQLDEQPVFQGDLFGVKFLATITEEAERAKAYEKANMAISDRSRGSSSRSSARRGRRNRQNRRGGGRGGGTRRRRNRGGQRDNSPQQQHQDQPRDHTPRRGGGGGGRGGRPYRGGRGRGSKSENP